MNFVSCFGRFNSKRGVLPAQKLSYVCDILVRDAVCIVLAVENVYSEQGAGLEVWHPTGVVQFTYDKKRNKISCVI